jgi:hypothetical protein
MIKRSHFLGKSEQGVFAQGLFSGAMEKTAGVPGPAWDTAEPIKKLIKTLKPEDRKKNCYVLVTALGAGEYYGANVNSDFFPWEALMHKGKEYGYETFLDSHAFAHHANKDPERAFGVPVVSALNDRMKKVELVIKLDREKAKMEGAGHIVDRIDAGDFPDVSMGCKVPFDVCSICGNRSKTRNDYCEHMRPGPEKKGIWGPNRILEDGRQICVYNTLPRFFDISFVFIGADKIAKAMAKLASRGSHVCIGQVCAVPSRAGEAGSEPELYSATGDRLELGRLRKQADGGAAVRRGPCGRCCASCESQQSCEQDKLASAFGVKEAEKKISSIVKKIPSDNFTARKLPEIEAKEKDFPKEVLDALAEYPLATSTGATTSAGIILKPHEFQRIVLVRMGEMPLADELDAKKQVFQPSEEFDDSVDPALPGLREALSIVMPYLLERSAFAPALSPRLMKLANSSEERKKFFPHRTAIGHPMLDKVSAAYNGYRRNILTKLSQAREAVQSDSQLRSNFFGDELVTMFSKTSSPNPIIDHNTVAYVMSAHLSNRSLLIATRGNGASAVAIPWLPEELSA